MDNNKKKMKTIAEHLSSKMNFSLQIAITNETEQWRKNEESSNAKFNA